VESASSVPLPQHRRWRLPLASHDRNWWLRRLSAHVYATRSEARAYLIENTKTPAVLGCDTHPTGSWRPKRPDWRMPFPKPCGPVSRRLFGRRQAGACIGAGAMWRHARWEALASQAVTPESLRYLLLRLKQIAHALWTHCATTTTETREDEPKREHNEVTL
jgi:hypothetical protein